jgi:hypothetical protein
MNARVLLAAWAGDLARPVPVAAAAVLAVNDHVLKGAGVVPAAVTGKLSDVAGLLVAGIAAVALARGAAAVVTGRLPRRDGGLAVAALAAVAAAFAALKLWPAWNRAVEAVWGVNELDPSDLWALPVLALAWLWLRDRELSGRRTGDGMSGSRTEPPRRFALGAAWLGVLLVCAATPAPPPAPPRPISAWDIGQARLPLACGGAVAWVSKSGKTGVGLTVRIDRRAEVERCEVRIATALMRLANDEIAGREIALPPAPPPDERARIEAARTLTPVAYHYLAFELDNQARWNRGERAASFELTLEVDGAPLVWRLPAQHHHVQLDAPRRKFW